MLKGNRGEWSEIYAFLYLLSEGKVYAADKYLRRIGDDRFLPIIRIIRQEQEGEAISYHPGDSVVITDGGGREIATADKHEIARQAKILYEMITLPENARSSFEAPEVEAFMKSMHVRKIKAPSKDKADIIMQIHDAHTGFDPVCGWSIKSELGNPPTLLNAGRTTNFVFEVRGLCAADVDDVNGISSNSKVKDRLSAICKKGSLGFFGLANQVFERNLKLIDSQFPAIMAEALKTYYLGQANACVDVVRILEENDPLRMGRGMYEYKVKKFLAAIALGMVPSKEWDGRDDATGGYVIVTQNGDVLAFHIYNRNEFEDYLFENTRFETASTDRHGFGIIYEADGKLLVNLNLQIRFNK